MTALLFVLFTLLQAGDGWTTWRIVRAGGVERNPLAAAAILRFGLVRALVALKVGLVLLIGALVWAACSLPHALQFVPDLVLGLLVVLYVAVVKHNLAVLYDRGMIG